MYNWARQVLWPGGRGWIWLAVCAVVAAVCVSFGIYLAASSKGNSAASLRPTATASTGTNPALAARPVSPAAAVANPAKEPSTPAHKVKVAAWGVGRGGAALAAVSGQLGNVLQAYGARQFIEMKQSCARLTAAVTTARANVPIPDAAMQRLYGKALTDLAEAATDCRAAISSQQQGTEDVVVRENVPLLQRALTAFTAGANDLYRATGKIKTRTH